MNRFRVLMGLAAGAFFLGGCTAEPTDDDLGRLVEQMMQQKKYFAMTRGLKPEDFTLYSVSKVRCQENSSGYRCDVQEDVETPSKGRQTRVDALQVSRGSDGWVLIR